MKARELTVLIFVSMFLTPITMVGAGYAKEAKLSPISHLSEQELPPGIGERCNRSAQYVDEIPARPGPGNAYAIELPAEPGHDVVVCTAFLWDSNGQIYHFGFDVGAECQSGFCVAGMDLWKHYYQGKFWFWWEDPPAVGPPTAVEVWFREVNSRERTPQPSPTYTPAPTATPVSTATPAPLPGDDQSPTQDPMNDILIWLPLVQKSGNNLR